MKQKNILKKIFKTKKVFQKIKKFSKKNKKKFFKK